MFGENISPVLGSGAIVESARNILEEKTCISGEFGLKILVVQKQFGENALLHRSTRHV